MEAATHLVPFRVVSDASAYMHQLKMTHYFIA
jgi:hypothetical protein